MKDIAMKYADNTPASAPVSAEAVQLPEPQAGGRYVRNTDGTLTTVHVTDPGVGRAGRTQEPASDAAPANTTETPQE